MLIFILHLNLSKRFRMFCRHETTEIWIIEYIMMHCSSRLALCKFLNTQTHCCLWPLFNSLLFRLPYYPTLHILLVIYFLPVPKLLFLHLIKFCLSLQSCICFLIPFQNNIFNPLYSLVVSLQHQWCTMFCYLLLWQVIESCSSRVHF